MPVGLGFDIHRFGPGRPLILGGVNIPHDVGLVGHSDADALLHALCDALLGAAGLGDIGQHFPDTDPEWKDADSARFVRHAVEELGRRRLRIVNVDATIITEQPKIGPHRQTIRDHVAGILGIDPGRVNIKAKTNEKVGPVGRGEALETLVAVQLESLNDRPLGLF
ncbi:MAG: 2-C-methyl-D-erythritol 2,4-cyclodiphosphate synthase [Trueperaceae bacterium]|nr:2-C-methyl-D-erythritol 2,4-cyclodiphosphate synthase [Trueperaceae bacterium]